MRWSGQKNDNALVQIGVTPDRLLEWMQNSDISKIVGRLPLVEGMSIYVVENATGTVLAATNDDILGYEIFPEDRIQDSLEEGKTAIRKRFRSKCMQPFMLSMKKWGNMIFSFPIKFVPRIKPYRFLWQNLRSF